MAIYIFKFGSDDNPDLGWIDESQREADEQIKASAFKVVESLPSIEDSGLTAGADEFFALAYNKETDEFFWTVGKK